AYRELAGRVAEVAPRPRGDERARHGRHRGRGTRALPGSPRDVKEAEMSKDIHHHTPAGYLAGFTLEGTKSGRLHVLNLRTGKEWPSTPYKAGRQRHFYKVKGADPDAFENELMRLESDALAVIHRVHESLE